MLKVIMKKRQNKSKKGFTLAELVIVVAIIAILTGLAVMVFGNITDTANQATFESNHRAIVSAIVIAVAEKDGIVSEVTLDEINKHIVSKNGETGVAKLNGYPKGAIYKLEVTGEKQDTFLVTSVFKDKELTYKSK